MSKKKTRVELSCSDEVMQLKDSPYQPRSDKKLQIYYSTLLPDTSSAYLLCHLPMETDRTIGRKLGRKSLESHTDSSEKSVKNPKEEQHREQGSRGNWFRLIDRKQPAEEICKSQ